MTINIEKENDIKMLDLNLEDSNEPSISFTIDSNNNNNNISVNDNNDILGLNLLANQKKQIRNDSSDDDSNDINNNKKKSDKKKNVNINELKIQDSISELKIDDTISDFKIDDTISDFKIDDTISDLKIDDTISDFKIDDTISDFKINDTISDFKIDDTISDLKIDDTISDFKINDTISDLKIDDTISDFKINNNINDIQVDNDNEINKPKTFEEIQHEKRNYLNKFERYKKKGINLERNFNINSDINDMKNEFERITYSKRVENSVKMQRQCLLAFATGLEMLNSKYDPFDVKLDGWSESLNENVNDYDEVFEDLYEKYKGKAEVAPELKLMMMVGGSAFMFHITNTMFKSSLPGMEQIIKQNPDIMKNFASAAMNTMSKDSPGLTNFIGEFGPQDLNNNYNNNDEENYNRRDMKGPSDINDILGNMGNNNFNRNNSMSSNSENDISSIRNINFDNKQKTSGITLEL